MIKGEPAIKRVKTTVASWIKAVQTGFDIRDVFIFGGLALMGYGLHMLRPWLGFAVAGLVLMYIGLFVGKRAK